MTALHRKPLGRGGPLVSSLCLGTMMFGDQTKSDEAGRILEAFFAAGGNFVDTADTYTGGASERMLGELLGDAPDDLFLATKAGNPVAGVEGSGSLDPAWLTRAVEMSCERLRRDRLDLLYLHLDDEITPRAEIVACLGTLLDTGQIEHWGVSNFRAWKMVDIVHLADTAGVARPIVVQPYYHMLNRGAEQEIIPAATHFGMGVVPYSVLGRGMLTGKYGAETPPEGSRAARGDPRLLENEFRPETMAAAARLADHARTKGNTSIGYALNWALANTQITSALIGPKSLAQLQGYLAAVAEPYDADDEALAEATCPSGRAPAPFYADPKYPYRGRSLA
ncbi:MAG: aldo/keto reductase [Pseudomonadota bacterium]